jgi:predicted dehydrogenase
MNVNPIVGLVGSGAIARTHVASWRQLDVPLRIYSPDTNLSAFCAEHKIVKADTLDELIASVDIVDVCAPTHVHAEIVTRAAAARRHVVCEKPLTLTLADARAVQAACQKADVTLFPCQVVRYFPEYIAAKRAVDAGRIGTPAVLRLLRKGAKPTSPWFSEPSLSGGLVVDQMIHDFDYARWVAGDVARVFAKVVDFPGNFTSAYAILTHRSGALTHVQGTWGHPKTVFETAFTLSGSAGQLRFTSRDRSPLRWDLTVNEEEGGTLLPQFDEANSPFTAQLGEFISAIKGGPPPRVTAADGIAALQIALAAVESAATNRAISI